MSILEKEVWIDPYVSFLSCDIVEYDMKEGGYSIIREESLLTKDEIEELSHYTKDERHVKIGKLQRGNPDLSKNLQNGFRKYRLLFGEENEISDEDILSVKKDAIFVKKYCYQLKFGNYIEFREKNIYQAFMRVEKYEFYWSPNKMDVKGILDSNLPMFRNLLDIVDKFIRKQSTFDETATIKYIVKVMDDYKNLRLDTSIYRPFKSPFVYHVKIGGMPVEMNEIGPDLLPFTDISYNYVHLLTPLLNIAMSK